MQAHNHKAMVVATDPLAQITQLLTDIRDELRLIRVGPTGPDVIPAGPDVIPALCEGELSLKDARRQRDALAALRAQIGEQGAPTPQ